MATVIQIKRSSGTTAPAELGQGELAYTYGTGTQGNNGDRIFIGTGTETDGVAANVHVIGGKYFADLTDHALGTLTASSALLVDSNKAIDEIFIGNNASTGGQLKLNEGTNNGTNYIGLKAPNAVTTSTTFTLPDGDGSNGQFLKTDGSGNLSFGTVVSTLSIAADSGSSDSVSTGETITFTGGTGIDTTVSDNEISFEIDSTVATLTGTQILTNKTISGSSNTISNIGNSSLTNSTISISDDTSSSTSIPLGGGFSILGGTGITSSVSGSELTLDIDNTVVTTSGTQTLTNKTLTSPTITGTGAIAGTFTGNITGDVTGNADTATALASAVNIAGQSFDGSGSITIASTDLSNTSAITLNTATQTLSGKTLTAPKFTDGGFIADANGNELILLQTETSAVNELEITNSATSNAVKIATSGDDTNIDLKISPKGSGVVDVDTSRITNVTDPSGAQDAATKAYVDSVANGLDVKESVRYASTANAAGTYDNGAGTITAGSNGAFSIDGQTPSASDRILLKDQSDATENGIYVVTTVGDGASAYVLTRGPDADTAAELTGGTFFFVEEGTANADNGYVATHNGTPTLGTTNITFSQFSGAGQISAGDALTKTGNTLNVAVDDSSIEVSGDALQIKASGVGTNQLASNAVTTIKITDANVTNAKLANSIINVTTDSGNQDIDLGDTLTVTGGEGIDTSQSGDTLTIAAELATVSNKGVASFSADNFLVSSGAVTVTTIDGGTF